MLVAVLVVVVAAVDAVAVAVCLVVVESVAVVVEHFYRRRIPKSLYMENARNPPKNTQRFSFSLWGGSRRIYNSIEWLSYWGGKIYRLLVIYRSYRTFPLFLSTTGSQR